MSTKNAVGNSLTGSTGSGSFVGATSPTLVTPTLGVASATSLTFSSTSGIIGTTTNDNAAAGSVGEYIDSLVSDGTVSLTTLTAANVTSISLTAGDWDVTGSIYFAPGAGTVVTFVEGWSSTSSASVPSQNSQSFFLGQSNAYGYSLTCPRIRVSISSTTTVYLSAYANFSTNTLSAGGWIQARRIR